MQIIQNAYAIQLKVGTDHIINFPIDELKDKKFNSIYLLNAYNPYWNYISPFDGVTLQSLGANGVPEDYYMNLIDNKGNQFVENLKFSDNFITEGNSDFYFKINRMLDLYKSNIRFPLKSDPTARTFILLATYQTKNFEQFDDEVNGSISFEVPFTSTNQDLCLKDFCPRTLDGKKIKRIIMSQDYYETTFAYLDLTCKDGKKIYNMPGMFLSGMTKLNFWLDYLDIDYDRSFIRQRGPIYYVEDVGGPDIQTPAKTYINFIF